MKKNYQVAIFDLDGTILDTLDDLMDSVNYALRQSRLPERNKEEIRAFVGNGIRKLIERAVPKGTKTEVIDEVFSCFKHYYEAHCKDKTKPYKDVVDVLHCIKEKGVKLAVLSNKADFAVQILCEEYFPALFDAVAGAKEGIEKKPSPDGVHVLLKELGVEAKEGVYIGDSDVDILTGANSSMDVLSVTWGFREEAFLKECGATNIVREPRELTLYI